MNLSIKNVPEEMVEQLRARARRNHRSLQGELLTILEETLGHRRLSFEEAAYRLHSLSLHTESESLRMIREDGDAR